MAEVRRANGLTEDFELGETQRVHVPSVVYGAPTIEIPVVQPPASPPLSPRPGMTLGRTSLLWLNKKVGERTIIFIYILLAIALEFIIWFVPSFTGGAVAIALVGTLLGPVYPLAMNHARRVLPAWLLTGCIGWIAGFGQAGSAVLPFVTGAIASKAGIASLQPLLVSMMGMLVLVWAFVPRARSHAD